MSTNVTWPPIGGTSYPVPNTQGETNWTSLTNYLQALGNAQGTTNQKVGVRVATSTPVTVASATDYMVVTNLAVAGAVTVNLPAAVVGQVFVIKDGKGDANTNNITINRNGTDTIDGATSLVLNINSASVMLACTATGSWSVASYNITGGAQTIPGNKTFTGITTIGPSGGGTAAAGNAHTIQADALSTLLINNTSSGATATAINMRNGATIRSRWAASSTNALEVSDQGVSNTVFTVSQAGAQTLATSSGLGTSGAAYHTVYGSIVGYSNASNAMMIGSSDRLNLTANIFRDGASTLKSISGSQGWINLELTRQASSSGVAFAINTDYSDAQTANAALAVGSFQTIIQSTAVGNWTFGSASAASTSHQFVSNGNIQVISKAVGTANTASFDVYQSTNYRGSLATLPSTSGLAFATGDVALIMNSQSLIFSADNGTTRHGSMRTDGSFTLGPTSAIGGSTFGGNKIVGKTDGSAVGAGYVGETPQVLVSTATNFPATSTYGDLGSLTLTPGIYMLSASLTAVLNGATCTSFALGIGTGSGTSTAGLVNGLNIANGLPPTSSASSTITISGYYVNVGVSTTYYCKVQAVYSAGTPQYYGKINAFRIA